MEISLGQINDLTLAIQEFSNQTSTAFDSIIAKVGEMCNELSKINRLSAGTLWDDIYNGAILAFSGLSAWKPIKDLFELLQAKLTLAAISQGLLSAATAAWSGICAAGTAVTSAFGAAIAFLASPVGLFIAGIVAVVAAIALIVVYWDEVVAAFTMGFEYLNEVFMGVPLWLYENVILPIVESIVLFIQTVWVMISTIIMGFMEILTTLFNFIVVDIIGGIINIVVAFVCQIANNFLTLTSNITNILVTMLTFIYAMVIAPLAKGFADCIQWIVKGFSDMNSSVKAVFLSMVSFVKDKVLSPLIDGIKAALNFGIGFVEGFVNAFISGVNAIINAFNRIEFSIPDWVPVIGGNSFGFSLSTYPTLALPRLAKGAVIPPSNQFLAILGDQTSGKNIETPESLMRQVFRQELAGTKGGGEMKVNVYLDGKQITATVEKYQRERGVTMVKGGLLYGV